MERGNIAKTQLLHVWHTEILGMLGDMAQRMGSRITEGGCVRQLADADAVQYDQCNSFESHACTNLPKG
ncbi:hypothetical protein D3C81_1966020 [compost metagenome]